MLEKILLISIGSALGGNARYWLGSWIQDLWAGQFPLGTFIVNISGAFVLGLLVSIAAESSTMVQAPAMRLLFVVGFLGAYTTFSTLEFETFSLINSGSLILGFFNAVGSIVAGYLAVWLGIVLSRMWV